MNNKQIIEKYKGLCILKMNTITIKLDGFIYFIVYTNEKKKRIQFHLYYLHIVLNQVNNLTMHFDSFKK